jgi:hypothetical protein
MIVRSSPPRYRYRGMGAATDFSAVANAIQAQEGYYPGSIAYRNNNPGNLMYAGQPGATSGPGGFAVFPDYQTGYNALLNQISLDASRGETISQFISKYAPAAGGNDPTTYASNVAAALVLSPGDPLASAAGGAAASDSMAPIDAGIVPDLSSLVSGQDMTAVYVGLGLLGGLVLLRLFGR